MKVSRPVCKRILIGILFPLFILGVYLYASSGSTAIRCIFFGLTGFYCPGCGSTRAIKAAIRGQFGQAFLYNPLLFIIGIPSVMIVVHEYLRIVFPGLGLKPIVLPWQVDTAAVALIFAFWILRNIPVFSFLAPG